MSRSKRDRCSAQVSVSPVRKPLSSSKYSWLQMPWNGPVFAVDVDHQDRLRAVDPDHLHRAGPDLGGGQQVDPHQAAEASATWPAPLRLEQLAQAILGICQRHARHDRLEEAEDDELAGVVGGDAAALEVEELGLVDRTDRAGVRRRGGSRAGRSRGSGSRPRAPCCERFIPNSPRKLSVPMAVFSIVIRPFMKLRAASWRTPLRAGCRSCRARCGACSWSGRRAASSEPKTISTCSTELPLPSRRLSTRLRTRRPPSWARAQWRLRLAADRGVAVLEDDLVDGASSWRLAPARGARRPPRRTSHRAREQGLRYRLRPPRRPRPAGRARAPRRRAPRHPRRAR